MEGHLHWGVSVPQLHVDRVHLRPPASGRARLPDPLPTVAPSTLSFLSQHSGGSSPEGASCQLRGPLTRAGSQALLPQSCSCSRKRWGLLPHAHQPGKCPLRCEWKLSSLSLVRDANESSKRTNNPIKKWAKNQKRCLSKKTKQNKKIWKWPTSSQGKGECSASLINREMQIKNTKISHLTPVRMPVIKKIRAECRQVGGNVN